MVRAGVGRRLRSATETSRRVGQASVLSFATPAPGLVDVPPPPLCLLYSVCFTHLEVQELPEHGMNFFGRALSKQGRQCDCWAVGMMLYYLLAACQQQRPSPCTQWLWHPHLPEPFQRGHPDRGAWNFRGLCKPSSKQGPSCIE